MTLALTWVSKSAALARWYAVFVNIYSDPEKFGCRIIGEIDLGGGYNYNMFVVWQRTDTAIPAAFNFGWGDDHGCSCYSAFAGKGVDDLIWGERAACLRALDDWKVREDGNWWDGYTDVPSAAELYRKIANA